MNRPRSTAKGNRLPLNLYTAGAESYRYKHPQTGKFHGMDSNKTKAISAANRLHALLLPANDRVESVITSKDRVSVYVDRWLNEIIPERKFSPGTLRVYGSAAKAIERTWGFAIPPQRIAGQDYR